MIDYFVLYCIVKKTLLYIVLSENEINKRFEWN